MGDKVHTLVIKVDLSCCRCRKCIQDYLCKIRCKVHIVSIVFEEKDNAVLVSGYFDPGELKCKLLCKFRKIIIDIYIKKETPPLPPPPTKKECKEHIEKIVSKRIAIFKKECEEKCKKGCEDRCKKDCCEVGCKCSCNCREKPDGTCKIGCEVGKLNCKCKCKCSCNCKEKPDRKCKIGCEVGKLNCKCKCKCSCNCEVQPVIPQPHVTGGCCATPCPCFAAWCNNYRCCSCGVVGWSGWWGCEPCRPPSTFICESTQTQCNIM